MEPLATVEDVARLGVDTSDAELIKMLLESVSSAVRDAAGSSITVTERSLVREGTYDQTLLLPGAPIREVKEVLIDDEPVNDYLLRDQRLWRSQGWGGQQFTVTVTYTAGLDKPPADIVKLVATLVAAGVNEMRAGVGSRRGIAYARVDDAQEGYTQGSEEIVDLTELPERTKAALAERFSGSVFVSRSL